MTRIINHFADISGQYDAAFVDLWGCMHNGIEALPDAVAAMQTYRAAGGIVVLVTNSPRPWDSVARQINGFGVPDDAWDALALAIKNDIVTEGKFYGFAAPQFLGNFFVLNQTKFWVDKQANLISFQSWEDIAMGIGNINGIAEIELS